MAEARSSHSGTDAKVAQTGQTAGDRARPSQLAYKSARAVTLLLVVVVSGVAADLLTKHYAFAALIDRPTRSLEVIRGWLSFTLSTNRGIVFGIELPGFLILTATLAAMAVVVLLFATSPSRCWALHAGLGMVLAGSIGNAYDRFFSRVWLAGEAAPRLRQVRDFIDVDLQFMRWPVFNVADVLLVVGVGLILIYMIRDGRRRKG